MCESNKCKCKCSMVGYLQTNPSKPVKLPHSCTYANGVFDFADFCEDDEYIDVEATISHLRKWKDRYHNAFKSPEMFWDKFFEELRDILSED